MSALTSLAVGDAFVVHDSQQRYTHRKVVKVGRVWLTDEHGHKYRLSDGYGEERLQVGWGTRALTVPDWEAEVEAEQLRDRLVGWGWVPRPKLSLGQMRRAVALIAEFESENSGGLV
jgi:hypothetical protein